MLPALREPFSNGLAKVFAGCLLAVFLGDFERVNQSATWAVIIQDEASSSSEINYKHRRVAVMACQFCLKAGIDAANVPLDIALHMQRPAFD